MLSPTSHGRPSRPDPSPSPPPRPNARRPRARLTPSVVAALVAVPALTLALAAVGGHLANTHGDCAGPPVREVILATTTSTQDTGLLDALVPMFEKATGYVVKVIAVGSGQALALGSRGEADVLLCHAPASEEELVKSGVVVNRRLVMHNDFVIVGPPHDPARIRGLASAAEAFRRIAAVQALFVSRSDDSGTHKKEKEIWASAGVKPAGRWYQETGSSMGQTLSIASEKQGYTLTDRGTYLALKDHLALRILLSGDPVLLNVYHVMQVNPSRFTRVNGPGGAALVEFLVSRQAQDFISRFGAEDYGEPLFVADAGKDEGELRPR